MDTRVPPLADVRDRLLGVSAALEKNQDEPAVGGPNAARLMFGRSWPVLVPVLLPGVFVDAESHPHSITS
jgi:hypothetical protein